MIELTLSNWSEKKHIPVYVGYGSNCLLMRPKGMGDCLSEDENGWPIMLELYEGKIKLIVYSDINCSEPTHVIDLTKALESNRNDSST